YDQDAINRRLYDQDAINRRLYDQDAINRRLYDQDAINRRLYDKQYQSDIAASFQQAVIDVLKYKTIKAAQKYKVKNILLGGGVSANKELQKQLQESIKKELSNSEYRIPNTNLTTDNALMIAVAAYYNIVGGKNIKSWKNIKADANLRL
ncbi:MAG: hypothetical protein U9N04_01915, partial [Patescibacteria group bacterium]|nr:hypothetical protein [Patescibacteria group bacterium]